MTQDYLTQPRDVRPHALLKALEEYEQAHLGTESVVQDAFSAMALQCLTFEPLANPALHPEAWRVVRPRLELAVRLTSEGTLDFQASPWPEKTQQIGAIRWQMEDFVAFPQENGQTKFPQVSLLSLDLEDLRFELRDPDLTVTEAATFRRRLLFACYEFVISRLAVHFECRIRTALFCFGTHSKLMIRDVAHQGDYLQSTDLKSEPERFEWHSRYLALCKTNGVGPAELLAFYEKFIADLPEHERSTTFRQFLGEGRHLSKGTDELLPILGVLTHPHQIPPLINHPSNEVESFLKQQTAQAEFDAIDSIAAVYCLERPEIFELMAAHYPSVLVNSVQRIHDVRNLIEAFAAASPRSVHDELERLHDKLLRILTGIWQSLTAKALHVRQRQLASQAEFNSFALLQSWASEHSPVVADWLNGLHSTVQPTTPRRARQPHGA